MMISDDNLKKKLGFNREELAKALGEEVGKLTPEEGRRAMDAVADAGDFSSVEEMLAFIRKAAR